MSSNLDTGTSSVRKKKLATESQQTQYISGLVHSRIRWREKRRRVLCAGTGQTIALVHRLNKGSRP